MQRLTSPAVYAASVAAGLVLTGAGALSVTAAPPWSAQRWPELAMSLVMTPALAWLAMDYWLAGHGWYSALFAALAAERIYLLAQTTAAQGLLVISPHLLAPLVLLLSVVLFRLALGRILARLHRWVRDGQASNAGDAPSLTPHV